MAQLIGKRIMTGSKACTGVLSKSNLYAAVAKRTCTGITTTPYGDGRPIGTVPALKTYSMYDTVCKYGARFKPGAEDYHMPPFYGGDSAPAWEDPTKTAKPNLAWADHVMGEMENTIKNAGIESCIYAKVDVKGRKATEFMNRISTRNVPRTSSSKDVHGQCRLAYVCKTDGQVMNDVSISTRADNDLYIIGLGGWGKWEMDLLESLRVELGYTAAQVQLTNVSHDLELIHVMGPKAVEIMEQVMTPDIVKIPFMHHGRVEVEGRPFEVQRMSYSGLPGFELHIPIEHSKFFYERLMDHPFSKAANLKPHGACAVQGLRSEMWYRGSADVKNIGHYSEVMIDKFIYKKKTFHGMDSKGKGKQVVMLDVNTPKGWEWGLHLGKYKVFADGKEVGTTLSSAYGGRSKKVHAFANLDAGVVGPGKSFTIQCHGQEFPATQLEKEYVAFTGKDAKGA
jgi:glycine cleavage system aminomethyltransferase T